METRSAGTLGVRYGLAALLLATAVPLWAQADTIGAATAEAEQEGYPVPSLESYRRVEEKVANLDAVGFVPGAETLAEPFAGPGGETVVRFTTGGVVWGYTLLATPGDAASVYFLRDPTCSGIYTERLKPGDPFGPPVCAAEAAWAAAAGGADVPSGDALAPVVDSVGAGADPEGGQAQGAGEGCVGLGCDAPVCVGLGCGDSVPSCVGAGCPQNR